MNKLLGILFGVGLILGLSLAHPVLALETESPDILSDRDLNETGEVNSSSGNEEIGEVENDIDHDSVAEIEGPESLNGDHATAEVNESNVPEAHDGVATDGPETQPDTN